MIFPVGQEITDLLAKIGDTYDLDPSPEIHQAAERVLLDLIQNAGFEAADAYKIVRAVYWAGWNEGWRKGYARPHGSDHAQTPL